MLNATFESVALSICRFIIHVSEAFAISPLSALEHRSISTHVETFAVAPAFFRLSGVNIAAVVARDAPSGAVAVLRFAGPPDTVAVDPKAVAVGLIVVPLADVLHLSEELSNSHSSSTGNLATKTECQVSTGGQAPKARSHVLCKMPGL